MTGLFFVCWMAVGAPPASAQIDAQLGSDSASDGGLLADGGPDAGPDDAPDAGAADRAPTASLDLAREAAPAPPPPKVRLSGQVLAKGTREPLLGASISIDAVPVTEAGEGGAFEVEVPPGRHRLQIQHPGHEPVDESLEVSAAMPPRLYRLAPRQTGERYETVVTPPDERASRTTLREDELTKTPGSFGDPFRVVESLPGVSQVAWPLAIYAIRGANPGNTGFFIDGIRIPALFHFALGPSVIHPFFLKEINFYPGGYPVQYGRYAAGVVTAQTASPPTDRVHATADVRLFDAGGFAVAPFNQGRGSVAVAGRFSYTGLIFSALSPDLTLNYGDYQVRVEHRLGPGRLTLFAFGSGDLLRVAGTDNPPMPGAMDPFGRGGLPSAVELSFHRVDLRWEGSLLGGQVTAGMLVGRDRSVVDLEAIAPAALSVRTLSASPRLHYRRSLAWWADLEAGSDAELQDFKPVSALGDKLPESDLFRERGAASVGGFLGFTFRTRSRLSISPALRYELFAEEGVERFEPSPRLMVRFRPAGEVWLKAAVGRYVQMASLPLQVPGFEGFGLRSFGSQWSLQGSLGVEAPLGGGALTLDATAYYQRLKLTDLESIFNVDPNRPNLVQLRDGESYGVEIMLRRPLTHRLSGWLAYTLSRSDRLIGRYRAKAASDWDQRHILNLVLGYRLRGGWGVSGRVHYNTGRPYPVYQPCTGRVDYQRLPPFFQLDGRVDKRFVFDRFVLSAYLELVNSTLSREVFDMKRSCDDTLDEKAFKIVLPSLGLHAEW